MASATQRRIAAPGPFCKTSSSLMCKPAIAIGVPASMHDPSLGSRCWWRIRARVCSIVAKTCSRVCFCCFLFVLLSLAYAQILGGARTVPLFHLLTAPPPAPPHRAVRVPEPCVRIRVQGICATKHTHMHVPRHQRRTVDLLGHMLSAYLKSLKAYLRDSQAFDRRCLDRNSNSHKLEFAFSTTAPPTGPGTRFISIGTRSLGAYSRLSLGT
jgi:hypothetical protein